GGATWPDILIDMPLGVGTGPGQLAATDDVLVCLNGESSVLWTSADNFAVARSTGLNRSAGAKGCQIVPAAGRFFIIGRVGTDNSNCKIISTADGTSFTESS